MIWSDESSIKLGKESKNIWVFYLNQHSEKWKKEYIIPYTKSKGLCIMIWAAIWGISHSEIIFLKCDLNLKSKNIPHSLIFKFWKIISFLYGNRD
jgi:hypothetical protein